MNEAVFVLAVLLEKGVITPAEAVALRKVATTQTLNNSLPAMLEKVAVALKEANQKPANDVEVVDAKDYLKKVL